MYTHLRFTNYCIAFLLSLLSLPSLSAQQIQGSIKDEKGDKLSFVTLRLLNPADSSLIDATTSDTDGRFSLQTKQHSLPLLLSASYVGYESLSLQVDGTAPLQLKMEPTSQLLDETMVIARRPKHRICSGGISTLISNSTLAKLPDVYHILAGLPLVQVSGRTIDVLGKGNPIIYINNKRLSDNQELEQLDPALIQKIDVITTPGASYNSSTGAVIRIYTKRQAGQGLSGRFVVNPTQIIRTSESTETEFFGKANLNYRLGRWDLYLSSFYWKSPFYSNLSVSTLGRADGEEWKNFSEATVENFHRNISNTIGVNYEDDKQSFGFRHQWRHNFYDLSEVKTKLTSQIDKQASETTYSLAITQAKPSSRHTPSLYYLRTMGDWRLRIDAEYFSSSSQTENDIHEGGSSDGLKHKYHNLQEKENDLWGVSSEARGKVGKGELNVGAGYSLTNRKDKFVADKSFFAKSSDTHIKEQSLYFYGECSYPLGPISATAGLRMEHTRSDYSRDGIYHKEFSRNYTNLFPSLSLVAQIDNWQWQLSHRTKIRRPQYWQLRAGYTYLNKFEAQTGTANLKPEYVYTTELTGKYKWITTSFSHHYVVDELQVCANRMPDPDKPGTYCPHATILLNRNAMPYHQLVYMASLNHKFGFWEPTLTAYISKQFGLKGMLFDREIQFDKPLFNFSLFQQFSLPHNYYITIRSGVQSTGDESNFRTFRPYCYGSLNISKQWMDERLSLSLEANDFFQKETAQHSHLYSAHSLMSSSQGHYPSIDLTLTYKFNSTKDKYKGRSALSNELKRL